jgi:hypothetical protein
MGICRKELTESKTIWHAIHATGLHLRWSKTDQPGRSEYTSHRLTSKLWRHVSNVRSGSLARWKRAITTLVKAFTGSANEVSQILRSVSGQVSANQKGVSSGKSFLDHVRQISDPAIFDSRIV